MEKYKNKTVEELLEENKDRRPLINYFPEDRPQVSFGYWGWHCNVNHCHSRGRKSAREALVEALTMDDEN